MKTIKLNGEFTIAELGSFVILGDAIKYLNENNII